MTQAHKYDKMRPSLDKEGLRWRKAVVGTHAGRTTPAMASLPQPIDRVPYLLDTGAYFGVRQLAAAFNRTDFLRGSSLPFYLPNRRQPS